MFVNDCLYKTIFYVILYLNKSTTSKEQLVVYV